MKILLVNCVFPPEPVVSAQIGRDLAQILSKTNSVRVITPMPSRPYGFDLSENEEYSKTYHLIRLKSYLYPKSGVIGRLKESISFGIASYLFIVRNNDIDKVYINTWPIFAQLFTTLACKRKQIPYFIHIQDVYPESIINKLSPLLNILANFILLPIDRYVLKNASKTIAISQNMKQYLSDTRSIESSEVKVVSNWQDEDDFKKHQNFWPDKDQKLTFMYLGNIGPVAGVDFLINAFAVANIQAKLIIAGSGSMKQDCLELASKLKGIDIEFKDVPTGKVAEIQSKSHVMLLPMVKIAGNNSIPSKLPAYMFSARPIIALADKASDIFHSIKESNAGWVGNSEDEIWLIKTFKEINQTDQIILKEKGIAALKYAQENFSKKKNLESLRDIIIN
jgi:glycosyltransferase involved in cell wall biosynthesis